MAVDRYFFIMIFAAGILIGGILVMKPEAAEASIPPYLWLLACMLVFESRLPARARRARHHDRHEHPRDRVCDRDGADRRDRIFHRFAGAAFLRPRASALPMISSTW